MKCVFFERNYYIHIYIYSSPPVGSWVFSRHWKIEQVLLKLISTGVFFNNPIFLCSAAFQPMKNSSCPSLESNPSFL